MLFVSAADELVGFDEVCDLLSVVCQPDVSKPEDDELSVTVKCITVPMTTAHASHIRGFGEYFLFLPF